MTPTELVLKPGQTVKLHARLFDAQGPLPARGHRRPGRSQGLKGTVDRRHVHRRRAIRSSRPGRSRRRSARSAARRARASSVRCRGPRRSNRYADGAVPPGWVNAVGRQVLGRRRSTARRCCRRRPTNTIFKRIRVVHRAGRLVELHRSRPTCASTTRRRQMGDIGITAQRYSLVLYGNAQQLKIEPWEPETAADGHGAVRLEGRHLVSPEAARREHCRTARCARAARRGRPASPSRRRGRSTRSIRSATAQGAPGFFVDAEFGAYLDNLKITAKRIRP